MKNIIVEPFIDFKELSEKTGLTVSYLKKAKQQYGLPFYKIGSLVKFKLSEVSVWLDSYVSKQTPRKDFTLPESRQPTEKGQPKKLG